MLLAILREYDTIAGSITVSSDCRTAYASQDAYLLTASSIRDNILFGQPYDAGRYQRTIHACALEYDLAEMEEGDRKLANGLSGGQRSVGLSAMCCGVC